MAENSNKNPKQDHRRYPGDSRPQKPEDTTVGSPNRNRQDPSKLPSDKGRTGEDLDLDLDELDDDDDTVTR